MSARWLRLDGRGKKHLVLGDESWSICNRGFTYEDESPFSGDECAICTRKATDEQLEAAAVSRKAIWDRADSAMDERREANRRGEFVVYRCRLCGLQHSSSGGAGVPFCMQEGHAAELEAITVTGPAWDFGAER